jgi:hypothetical protein
LGSTLTPKYSVLRDPSSLFPAVCCRLATPTP